MNTDTAEQVTAATVATYTKPPTHNTSDSEQTQESRDGDVPATASTTGFQPVSPRASRDATWKRVWKLSCCTVSCSRGGVDEDSWSPANAKGGKSAELGTSGSASLAPRARHQRTSSADGPLSTGIDADRLTAMESGPVQEGPPRLALREVFAGQVPPGPAVSQRQDLASGSAKSNLQGEWM